MTENSLVGLIFVGSKLNLKMIKFQDYQVWCYNKSSKMKKGIG